MLINTDFFVTGASIIIVFTAIVLTKIIHYIQNTLNKSKKEKMNISEICKYGYLISLTNIIIFIGYLYCVYH